MNRGTRAMGSTGEARRLPPGNVRRPALLLAAWAAMILAALWLAACSGEVSSPALGDDAAVTGGDAAAGAASAAEDGDSGVTTNVAGDVKEPSGYITFVINVHDTEHIGESADTLLRLIDLYEKHGVRGDFYLTSPVVELYAAQRPEVIERLRDSGMGISYHVRPPHPLYSGFDQRWSGLDQSGLEQTLLDYETFRLDPATGGLITSEPGGYTYLTELFGAPPVVASAPLGQQRVKAAAEEMYTELGARMTIRYHEEGTDPGQPFEWVNGLLVRPSDFSVTRWSGSGDTKSAQGKDPFWWNFAGTDRAAAYDPVSYLKQRLDEWWAGGSGRAPFITSLIHENNFYRSGAEGWTLSYYTDEGKEQPLQLPFDLEAPDPSRLRTASQQEAIWTAYEQMVAWAAANLKVVTSGDIVEIARSQA